MTLDQRHRRNVFRAQLLKSRTIITNGAQHLDFTAIEVILDIDTRAEGSFTGPGNHNQPRRILHRIPQRRRQLIDHFNAENIKRWPIKDQPENIMLVPNMQERHTKYFLFTFLYSLQEEHLAPFGC